LRKCKIFRALSGNKRFLSGVTTSPLVEKSLKQKIGIGQKYRYISADTDIGKNG